ncbi:MAG: HAD family phosphatase [FCB group bacterium]|nr:HAD family phosphatase [FCB group bacterium]
MNSIEAILFDLDGVVIDSEPLYQKGEIRLFREYGVEIPEDDWLLFRGSTEKLFYQMARDRYHLQAGTEDLRKKGRGYVLEEFAKHLDYMPGFTNLMKSIDGQFKVGLVTATPADMFEWVNLRLNLRKFFPHILTGDMTSRGKPHPDPYLKMMNILGVLPQNCIVIEDSHHGITSGLRSGARVIALTGSAPYENMPDVHAIVTNLSEITPDLIRSISA